MGNQREAAMKNYLLLCLLFSFYIFTNNLFPQEWKIPNKLSASFNGSIIIIYTLRKGCGADYSTFQNILTIIYFP